MPLRIRSHSLVYLGVPYTLTLDALLVVRLRYTNKHFWCHCRGSVVVSIFKPSGPCIYLFNFLDFYLIDMPSCQSLSTPWGEFILEQPSTSSSSCELCPGFIAMVQNWPFSGASNEDPHNDLIKFERLCSSLAPPGMIQKSLRLKLFPLSHTQRGWSNGTLTP
jgi:hypothetical protein